MPPNNTLNDIQNAFKTVLLDQPEALQSPPEVLQSALKQNGMPLPERLKVYRTNVVGSLTDALIATFPTIETLTGRDFLEFMARTFVLAHPPAGGCINEYGNGFDTFIETFEPAKSLPYLPDMARLDLAMNDAYFAPDDLPLAPEALASIPPEELGETVLHLRQSVTLIASDYPLIAIREFCQKTQKDRNAPDTLDLDQGGVMLMVYRPALDVEIVPLSGAEYTVLKKLQKQTPLRDAVTQTLETHTGFDLPAFLQKHLTLQTFCTVG